MFAKLKQRWQDTRTIMALSLAAERRALREGQRHPGAEPSGQALMQSLPELQRRLPAPLCGAHVLLAAENMAQSAAGRAFKAIGIDLQALGSAAEAELRAAISS